MKATTTKPRKAFLAPKRVTLVVAGALLLLTSGCTTQHANMVKDGEVSLQVVETSPITVTRASVIRGPKGVTLSGHVARHRSRALPLRGHVDAEFFGPDGEMLYETSLRFTTRRHTRHTWQGTFIARLNFDLPPGSSVRVVHHDGEHTNG
ncbi:MAG: hypothetical protein WBG92_25295 [Thiohalocapsa sp.]